MKLKINHQENVDSGHRLIYTIALIYITIVSVFMISHRAWLSPDQFFAFAILAVILIGRTKQFLWDWVPVLLLLFGYEYLRGLIPQLSGEAHIWPMINADYFLFGFLPTLKLQSLFFNSSFLQWYDYLAVTLYISHFVIPMGFTFILWLYDRKTFKQFTLALLVLSYLSFLTYIVFPAIPPWMASDLGFLPPLAKIMDQVLISFRHPISVPTVYQYFGANLVAAVPSLHAAYPWLIFLFLFQKFRFLAIFSLPYVFGVWFAIVYLGEHYVVDAILGMIYATLVYLVLAKIKIRKTITVLSKKNETS